MNIAEGYAVVKIDGRAYNLAPSFGNMAKLGSPKDLPFKYKTLYMANVIPVSAWHVAFDVLVACGIDPNELGSLHFSERQGRCIIRPGNLPLDDMLILAKHCFKHGMCGTDAQVENTSDASPLTEFDPYQFISVAMEILGISLEQAEALTMTKFIRMADAKIAANKIGKPTDVKDLSKAQVSDIMAEHRRQKALRAAKQAKGE